MSVAAEKAKTSAEFQQLREHLLDRHWRINNLYKIKDEDGNEIPYRMNAAQRAYDAAAHTRNALPKARRLGFSTHIGISMMDRMVFVPNTRCGIIDLTLDDAESKLATMKFAYESLPDAIKAAVPLSKPTNQGELTLANGSSVAVGTSHRGGGLNWLHWSEGGKLSVENPDAARNIVTGAFPAVPRSGRIDVESTAHGTSGRFYDIVTSARALQDARAVLNPIQFKLHFFGWWMKREYRLQSTAVVITDALRQYFAEVQKTHGIRLDPEQRAWYAQALMDYGPDDIKEEFPTTIDELFFNSRQGAYFREEISTARREQRIGLPLPFDPTRAVNTFWDIGEDGTAIWFHQTDGWRHRFIDYWEMIGSGSLQMAATALDDKRRERGFNYGTHYGPHDLENRDWANASNTRKATALALGIAFKVVPKVAFKDNAIAAARRMFAMSAFCATHTKVGVERLENYHKKWNKTLGVFLAEPVHDENSHGADAFMCGAMDFNPARETGGSRAGRSRPPAGVSQWGR